MVIESEMSLIRSAETLPSGAPAAAPPPTGIAGRAGSYLPASAQGYATTAGSYASSGLERVRDGIGSIATQERKDQVSRERRMPDASADRSIRCFQVLAKSAPVQPNSSVKALGSLESWPPSEDVKSEILPPKDRVPLWAISSVTSLTPPRSNCRINSSRCMK